MTLRTRHLAAGILAAVLMVAPVACSDDDGDDASSAIDLTEDTTLTEGDEGVDNDVEGTDEGSEGGTDEGGTDEGGTDEGGTDEGGTDEGGTDTGGNGTTTETVATPPEAQAFCDQLESMNDIEPEGLDEIRGAFGQLDSVVPDEIREPYDTLMDKLASASSEDDLENDADAESALIAVGSYAATNCGL